MTEQPIIKPTTNKDLKVIMKKFKSDTTSD
jgi:hypothetical protein